MKDDGKPWSPYIAGGLSGILSILSVFVADKFLGASTTFVRSAGMIEEFFNKASVNTPYYLKYDLAVDWQFMFMVGIVLGAFAASKTDKSFKVQGIPDMWVQHFGQTRVIRAVMAFIGGIIALFGARLAGGCPSGHGLSGVAQLSVSSFAAAACFFIGGVVMARMIYGGGK